MNVFPCLLPVVLLGFPAYAEQVNIGHLETNDDSALNWAFFHCDLLSDQITMHCDIFTTILYHKPIGIDSANKAIASNSALQLFNQIWGDQCKGTVAMIISGEKFVNKGVDAQGRPLNMRVALYAWPKFKAAAKVCTTQTEQEAKAFFTRWINEQKLTCTVHSGYSNKEFKWDKDTSTWISRQGPEGSCGSVQIGTLSQDQSSAFKFWQYSEKTYLTRGDFSGCEKFPDTSLNYTWKTTITVEDCKYIESEPN